MIELICVDVDGTLVGSSGDVAAEVWPAVERARAAGARLVICSGRPAFGLTRELAERLDPEGWHVFQNGASIVHLPSGRSRSGHVPRKSVQRLMDRARRTGRILELYTDTEYAVESTDGRAGRHAGLLGVPFAPRPFACAARKAPAAPLPSLSPPPHPQTDAAARKLFHKKGHAEDAEERREDADEVSSASSLFILCAKP